MQQFRSIRSHQLKCTTALALTKTQQNSQPRSPFSSTPDMQQGSAPSSATKDWSAKQYLKFGNERTRPVYDLVSQIPLAAPSRITDLGCGPGNSTSVLAARFPDARIAGMDSSPDMLSRARATLPGVDFHLGDLHTYQPATGADLLFSNAVYHWLRRDTRIPTILRLLATQAPGGVFAFQVPDNYDEPSHKAMREAAAADGPWREYFDKLGPEHRPDLDPIESPAEWYDALIPHCEKVDIWHTHYQHIMAGHQDIVEWVKGTGLQPFVNALPEGAVREGYLDAYKSRLEEVYPRLADGKVMLRYPRLFVVATRK